MKNKNLSEKQNLRRRILSFVSNLPLLLLIPYFWLIILEDVDYALALRRADVDNLLPAFISNEMQINFMNPKENTEPEKLDPCLYETLKCQIVIARSNLCRRISENQCIFQKRKVKNHFSLLKNIFLSDEFWKCVQETKGEVLKVQDKWKLVPYHEISAGYTREGIEVMHDESYDYLASVNSMMDQKLSWYKKSVEVSGRRFSEIPDVKKRDSSGYVLYLVVNGKWIDGETFRKQMGLPSAAFTIEEREDKILFVCRGQGHGLGYSIYGGMQMSLEGYTYKQILENYFPRMELVSVHM